MGQQLLHHGLVPHRRRGVERRGSFVVGLVHERSLGQERRHHSRMPLHGGDLEESPKEPLYAFCTLACFVFYLAIRKKMSRRAERLASTRAS